MGNENLENSDILGGFRIPRRSSGLLAARMILRRADRKREAGVPRSGTSRTSMNSSPIPSGCLAKAAELRSFTAFLNTSCGYTLPFALGAPGSARTPLNVRGVGDGCRLRSGAAGGLVIRLILHPGSHGPLRVFHDVVPRAVPGDLAHEPREVVLARPERRRVLLLVPLDDAVLQLVEHQGLALADDAAVGQPVGVVE